jgi:hypothetical protein
MFLRRTERKKVAIDRQRCRFRGSALRSDQHPRLRKGKLYFEVNASDLPEGDKRRHGYSRDKRPDCPQLVIALVVTPEGLPLAYEVLSGNTADCKTLRPFLTKIEQQSCPCEGEGRQSAARVGDGSRCADRGGSG